MNFQWEFCELNRIAINILFYRDKAVFNEIYKKYFSIEVFENTPDQLVNLLSVYHLDKKELLIEKCQEIGNVWSKYDSFYISFLEKVFEIEIETNFAAFFTFLPLYPRDIEKKQFLIPFNASVQTILSVISHELNHFYFYEKLKSIPKWNISNNHFNKKVWYLSEMLIPLFFNLNDLQIFMGKLISSNYLFKIEALSLTKPLFDEWYKKNITFEELILKFIDTKIPSEFINQKYVNN